MPANRLGNNLHRTGLLCLSCRSCVCDPPSVSIAVKGEEQEDDDHAEDFLRYGKLLVNQYMLLRRHSNSLEHMGAWPS